MCRSTKQNYLKPIERGPIVSLHWRFLSLRCLQGRFLVAAVACITVGQNDLPQGNRLKDSKYSYFQVFPGFPAISGSSQISRILAKFGLLLAKKGDFLNFHQKVKT